VDCQERSDKNLVRKIRWTWGEQEWADDMIDKMEKTIGAVWEVSAICGTGGPLERHKLQPLEVAITVSSYNTGYFRDSPDLLFSWMVQATGWDTRLVNALFRTDDQSWKWPRYLNEYHSTRLFFEDASCHAAMLVMGEWRLEKLMQNVVDPEHPAPLHADRLLSDPRVQASPRVLGRRSRWRTLEIEVQFQLILCVALVC
jgi:hypothetical protein